MNSLQNNLEDRLSEIKLWVHNHMHNNHKDKCDCECNRFYNYHHFTKNMNWFYFSEFLPEKISKAIHEISIKEHEVFLSEYFNFRKKYKELKHKYEILSMDIMEQCHAKKEKMNKKIVSESLAEMKKIKKEMYSLIDKEKDRFIKTQRAVEEKIYELIQNHLK